MNDAEIQAFVDASVARALAAKDTEIAAAIAQGLRVYADRPVGEKGAPSLQFGVVEQVNDTYAFVTLDGQTDAVPINMLGGLVEGERVAVLLFPPSGNLAIGMFQPTVVPGVGFPGESGFYATGPSATTVPNNVSTLLVWPAFALGTDLLDLTVTTAPAVLADGVYTFDVACISATPGTQFQLGLVASDAPFTAVAGNGSGSSTLGASLTAFLHAGATFEVGVAQQSGGPINMTLNSVTVTKST